MFARMRPFIARIIEQLIARHSTTTRIDLNDIAEVVAEVLEARAISYDEVDFIISHLQDQGCIVGGEPTLREMQLLRAVLTTTRQLRDEIGRTPSIEEIASAADQPAFVVRRALENGGSLGKSVSET